MSLHIRKLWCSTIKVRLEDYDEYIHALSLVLLPLLIDGAAVLSVAVVCLFV